jgi:hypothetical protein
MKMPETDDLSAQTPESCINRSDIIRMAREARMPYFYGTWEIANLDGLERFAALVAAHEREGCAKFCEEQYMFYGYDHVFADGIRARGEKR